MKALLIGGTGTISKAVAERAILEGWELSLLNRGISGQVLDNAEVLIGDINTDETAIAGLLADRFFDVIADFIAYRPDQIERDIRLLSGKTRQFIFVSSASAYQKPLNYYRITESTPLANPFWDYSRNKIACEELLSRAYRSTGFPFTIVRPSHTYGERSVPVAVHGSKGSWQVIDRIRSGKPVIIHGDGTSLWTLTHNSDFAKGFCGLMGNPAAIGEAVHITSDESLSWNHIYDCIGAALDVPVLKYHISSDFLASCDPKFAGTLGGDKAYSVVFDNSKLKRLVPSFQAEVRFDQGVRRCIDYLLSHPEAQTPDPEFDSFCNRIIAVQDAAIRIIHDVKPGVFDLTGRKLRKI